MFMIIDRQSGTCFSIAEASLVNVDLLTDDEREALDSGGDSDIIDIAKNAGVDVTQVLQDPELCLSVAQLI